MSYFVFVNLNQNVRLVTVGKAPCCCDYLGENGDGGSMGRVNGRWRLGIPTVTKACHGKQ